MKIVWGIHILVVGILIGILATSIYGTVQYPLGTATERISPQNHVPDSKIEVYGDRVILRIDNPKWATFADTNSMDPVFDAGNHAIQIVPSSPDQIEVGDIVTYKKGDKNIIHRVVEKNIDEQGWYFRVQGDNNPVPDSGKVRFEDITRLVVAVVY
jgi:signal peptidase I